MYTNVCVLHTYTCMRTDEFVCAFVYIRVGIVLFSAFLFVFAFVLSPFGYMYHLVVHIAVTVTGTD